MSHNPISCASLMACTNPPALCPGVRKSAIKEPVPAIQAKAARPKVWTNPANPYGIERFHHEARVGLAVAAWQGHETDRALTEYAVVVNVRPEWLNPRWVEALYSPGVARTIEELKAEQKKRQGKSGSYAVPNPQ